MFQNINNSEENNEFDVNKRKIDFKSLFTINDIVLYAIAFMMSMVSFNGEFAPFGLAIFAAACSNRIPAGIVYIVAGLGTLIGFGLNRYFYVLFNIIIIHSININI